MKAIITIDKNLAIIAGHENFGEKEIDFSISELTKEERKELVTISSNSEKYDMSEKDYKSHCILDSDLRTKYVKTGIENPGIEFIKQILKCRIENKNEQKIRNEKKSKENAEKEKNRITEKRKYIEKEIEKGAATKLIEYRYNNYIIDSFYFDYLKENEKNLLNDLIQNKKEKKEKEKKANELKKEAFENNKKIWIENKGSDRLYKGFINGYNINTLYIKERAENELSKFGQVYFDSKEKIEYSERINPSLIALKLEEKIKKDGYKTFTKIVWCKEDYDNQYEAIHILFLEKYDIFIMI
jgi:hypothetical protein